MACSLSWTRLDRNALTLRITPENGDVTIQLLNVRLITAKRVSELESAPLWKILMLMIFALPVVWLLQSRPVASQWFITGTGIVILLVLQPRFTAVLLVFLVVMFYVGRLLQQRKKRPFGALLALLLASLGFLILFKMGLAPWRQTSSPTSAVSASSCPSDYPTSSSA